jgi:hypothetical protein
MKKFMLAAALVLGVSVSWSAAMKVEVVLRQPDDAGAKYVAASNSEAYVGYVPDKEAATVFTITTTPDATLASLYLWNSELREFLHLECDEAGELMLIPNEFVLPPEAEAPWTWTMGEGLISFGEEPSVMRLIVEAPSCADGRVLRTLGDAHRV